MLIHLLGKINALFSSPDIIIRMSKGTINLKKGKLSNSIVRDIHTLLRTQGCSNAWIHFYTTTGKPAKFSSNIPKKLHQKIRNIWMS